MRHIDALSTQSNDSKSKSCYYIFKRFFDIIFSILMIICLAPVLLIVSIIASIDTKGSPFFTQDRIGRFDVPFKIYKIRTMSTNAPSDIATHMLKHPERYISPVGEFFRRTSIDELPQLFNVLKGDMSFIGPRPVVLTETDLIDLRHENGASSVRPGITGLAQVSGRDTVTISEKARLDSEYAKNYSLKMDVCILIKTALQVVHSEGIVEGENKSISDVKKDK